MLVKKVPKNSAEPLSAARTLAHSHTQTHSEANTIAKDAKAKVAKQLQNFQRHSKVSQ